jgi:hypothetical protein
VLLIEYFTKDYDKKKYKDGHSWCYFSISELQEKYYSHLSSSTLYRVLKGLEDDKLIITGNYNKLRYDRTKWYRINYEMLDKILTNFIRNEKNQYEPKYQDDKIEFINMLNENIIMTEDENQPDETILSKEKVQSDHIDETNTIETKEPNQEDIKEYNAVSNLSSHDKLPEDKSSGSTDTQIKDIEITKDSEQCISDDLVSNQQLKIEALINLSPGERMKVLNAYF